VQPASLGRQRVRGGGGAHVDVDPSPRAALAPLEALQQPAAHAPRGGRHRHRVHGAQRAHHGVAPQRPRERRRIAQRARGDQVLDVGHAPVIRR
jgi:hypothetical protein